jgi:hypothetical protein|nr:hypothetical protein [Neorhizobium tomejilense]
MLTRKADHPVGNDDGKRDISEIYSIRHGRDSIRIVSPEKKTLTINSRNDVYIQALSQFAPMGLPTLRPECQMALVEAASGRSIEFKAIEFSDIAAVMAAFCVGEERAPEAKSPPAEPTPLPDILFEEKPAPKGGIPEWISANPDFKRNLVIDEGKIVLDFTALRMNAKQKYSVDGRAANETGEVWGYEVLAKGRHFGWVVLLEPNCVLVTGVSTAKHSKHRTVMSAMFRLSSHLQAVEEA